MDIEEIKIKRYLKFLGVHQAAQMKYKVSFIIAFLGRLLTTFVSFLTSLFLVLKFKGVGFYSKEDMIISFSVILLGISLAEVFFRGFDSLSVLIRNGEFDRMLVRPQSLLTQIIESRISFERFGAVILSLSLLIFGVINSSYSWNIAKIILLAEMVIGAFLIYAGLFIIGGSLCFITIEKIEVLNLFTYGTRSYGAYPFSIFGSLIKNVLTFIVPLTLVQEYPISFLSGKNNNKLLLFSPLFSIIFILVALIFFKKMRKYYSSNGS